MNYFLDTEFIEGKQTVNLIPPIVRTIIAMILIALIITTFIIIGAVYVLPLVILAGIFLKQTTPPTIDLISIAIVAEDGRHYYAISKDFNIKEAWNRWQPRKGQGDKNNVLPREYWIRENVLRPIWEELEYQDFIKSKFDNKNVLNIVLSEPEDKRIRFYIDHVIPKWDIDFSAQRLRYLVDTYGKTNRQIAEEVVVFCKENTFKGNADGSKTITIQGAPVFYGYYCDYDWVVFCWLFGKMNNLPNGFPMYCRDLKQKMDEATEKISGFIRHPNPKNYLKERDDFPRQADEHHALADAKWILKLHKFLLKF